MKKGPVWILLICIITSFTPRPLTWTAIGDSITYLNDHPDETGNRVNKGYLTRVTEKLKNIKYLNQGHNGWTAWQIAEEIDSLGIQPSDIYSVFLGTNDWWQGHPVGTLSDYTNSTGIATTCGAFRIIIDKVRKLNPKAKIVLITPMQRVDFVYIPDMHNNAFGSYQPKKGQILEQFANAIDSIGKHEHFPVIDLYHSKGMELKDMVHFKRLKDTTTGAYQNYNYPDFIGVPFNPDIDEYPYPNAAIDVTYDGLHPSDKGNKIIARKLISVISQFNK